MSTTRTIIRRVKEFTLRHKFLTGFAALALVAAAAWPLLSGGGAPPAFETAPVVRGDVVRQVSVSGRVVPADEVALGFSQSGRIARVYAREGQRVSAGEVLAELDSADMRAALAQRQAALEVQRARLASLEAGVRPEEIAVAEGDVRASEASLAQANDALADVIRDAYIKADDAVRNRLYQFVSNPRTNPQVQLVSSDAQAVIDMTAGIVSVEAALIAWQSELMTLESSADLSVHVARAQQRLAAVSSLLNTSSRVLNTTATVNISQATLDGYITSIAAARTSVSTVTSALTSSVTAQKNAAASLEASKKNLTLRQAGTVQADIDAQKAQVRAAEADVASAQAQLEKLRITAPFSGLVTTLSITAGATASPGTPAISLISTARYEMEAEVPENDIAGLDVGDRAEITFDALDDVRMEAQVVYVASAASNIDGGVSFDVRLQFTEDDERVRSGLTADAEIFVDRRDGVLTVPVRAIIEEGGRRYVRVMEGDMAYRRVPVMVGLRGGGAYEIVGGLGGGERIITFANGDALSALQDLGIAAASGGSLEGGAGAASTLSGQ